MLQQLWRLLFGSDRATKSSKKSSEDGDKYARGTGIPTSLAQFHSSMRDAIKGSPDEGYTEKIRLYGRLLQNKTDLLATEAWELIEKEKDVGEKVPAFYRRRANDIRRMIRQADSASSPELRGLV